jgi:hypothetical protein
MLRLAQILDTLEWTVLLAYCDVASGVVVGSLVATSGLSMWVVGKAGFEPAISRSRTGRMSLVAGVVIDEDPVLRPQSCDIALTLLNVVLAEDAMQVFTEQRFDCSCHAVPS